MPLCVSLDQTRLRIQEGYYCSHMIADIVQQNTFLKTLELVHCDLSDGMMRLAQGLATNTTVTTLCLDQCRIIDRGMELLFTQGLKHNTALLRLKLRRCQASECEVRTLTTHWQAETPIQSLSLESSSLDPWEARALLQKIANQPAMRTLELRHDPSRPAINIGYEGIRRIAQEFVHQRYLTHFDLSSCTSYVDMTDTATMARDQAETVLLEGIQRNLSICHLNLSDNALSPTVIKDIDFHVGLNRTGRYLLCTNHSLASSAWSVILAKCQVEHDDLAASLTYYYLREQPHLVHSSHWDQ